MNQPPICPKADNVVRTLSQTPPPTYPKLFWLFCAYGGQRAGSKGATKQHLTQAQAQAARKI